MVKGIIKEKCRISENVIIERAHRLGRKRTNTGVNKPRPLIVKFLDYNHRQSVKESRRNLPSGVSVSEDFPIEVRDARQKMMPELLEAKRNGKQAWLAYPARLIIDGREVRSIRPTTTRDSRQ